MFQFPRTKFVDENTFKQQLRHLKSEVREVKKAKTRRDKIGELWDVIHSAETAIRMLMNEEQESMDKACGTPINDWGYSVAKAEKEHVEQKNRECGYYD